VYGVAAGSVCGKFLLSSGYERYEKNRIHGIEVRSGSEKEDGSARE
jgi:hypothetical protein